ncbi:MAG: lipoyl synthase [Thermodesulfobacteriota bacterium]
MDGTRLHKPPWLKRRIGGGSGFQKVSGLIRKGHLHTVCQEALCPNQGECFSRGTATFLILGKTCTRNCGFCAVRHGIGQPLDPEEPSRVAEAALALGLSYVVVTSVTRDDLPDGGANQFARTVREIRRALPEARVEVLVPDFQGSDLALQTVLIAGPDVLNHNVETVPRLYPKVRPQADYRRSLELLRRARSLAPEVSTKSGLMLGLGEEPWEVQAVLADLLAVGCRMVTIGQYLRPSMEHLPVERYVTPQEFESWRELALEMGFLRVASGPFVRSSYHAGEMYRGETDGSEG